MEPRPQRPRTPSGGPTQGTRSAGHPQPAQQTQAFHPSEYPEGIDPTSFIAPPRTEYDYSPLDLAPPGQRRRRQLVAAAVGGFSVLLIGAIVFFSYLLLRDEDAPSQNDDLLAAQTQVAERQATLDAQSTIVAQAAAEQTAQAAALDPDASAPAATEASSGQTEETPPESGETPATTDETPPAESAATEPAGDAAPDLSGNASLTAEQLTELLPPAEQVPETLTEVADDTRSLEQVIEALGGGRPAETNLADWGWTGNVERQFLAADAETADPASTTVLTVSIHGFGSPEAAAEALPFFSDILVNTAGYTEVDAPELAELGDAARLLTVTDEQGQTTAALYFQDGSVLYRLGGFSPAGDPSQDVIGVATALLGG